MARYVLGDLAPDEMRRIEEDMLSNYRLRREIETAEEQLIAAYVVGSLREQERAKFEAFFLTTDQRRRKLAFARAWVETGGTASPDLNSPFHRYLLDQMTSDEADRFEESLLNDEDRLDQLGVAEDELLMAYFHGRLPEYQMTLFETNFLPLKSDRMLGKLRFAHIICEYERAAITASPTPENIMEPRRRRSEKASSHRGSVQNDDAKSGSVPGAIQRVRAEKRRRGGVAVVLK